LQPTFAKVERQSIANNERQRIADDERQRNDISVLFFRTDIAKLPRLKMGFWRTIANRQSKLKFNLNQPA